MTPEVITDVEQLRRLHERVARARRTAVAGAVVGLGAGVLLSVAVTSAGESVIFWLGVLVIPAALFGAIVGHLLGGGRLNKLLNDAIGLDIGADRIKRAVAGRPETLTPAEQERAARYAALAAIALPAQAMRWWLTTAALFIAQALRLLLGPAAGGLTTDSLISGVLGLVSAVLLAGTGLAQARAGRQARAYAAAHPLRDALLKDRP